MRRKQMLAKMALQLIAFQKETDMDFKLNVRKLYKLMDMILTAQENAGMYPPVPENHNPEELINGWEPEPCPDCEPKHNYVCGPCYQNKTRGKT